MAASPLSRELVGSFGDIPPLQQCLTVTSHLTLMTVVALPLALTPPLERLARHRWLERQRPAPPAAERPEHATAGSGEPPQPWSPIPFILYCVSCVVWFAIMLILRRLDPR